MPIDPATLPDFDRVAKLLVEKPAPTPDVQRAMIASALEAAWNSRGTVDLSVIEASLSSMMGATAAGPYVKNLTRTLRQLDLTPKP